MGATLNGGGTIRGDLRTHLIESPNVREQLIAPLIAPSFSVGTLAGQYPKFTLNTGKVLDIDVTVRGPTAEYGEVKRRYELATYTLKDYGLKSFVDGVQAQDTARFFDAEVVESEMLFRSLLLAHEQRVANLVQGSSFTAVNSAVAYTQGNLATADFLKDVQAGVSYLRKRGYVPNTIVMSQDVFDYVSRTTLFQNAIKPYSAGVSVVGVDSAAQALAGNLGIPSLALRIGALGYNSSKTTTASITNIWSNTHIWIGRVEGGEPRTGGALRTFAMDGADPEVKTWDDPDRESTGIRVRHVVEENVIDANAGYRITTQYA